MKNSIEENIKTLRESIIEEKYYIFNKDLKRAIENLLSDYKKILKENEQLSTEVNSLKKENEELNLKYSMLYTGKIENLKAQEVKIKSQVIPVQKVKDKIEELKQEKKKYGNCLIEMYEDELVNRDIKILQELLESEK